MSSEFMRHKRKQAESQKFKVDKGKLLRSDAHFQP